MDVVTAPPPATSLTVFFNLCKSILHLDFFRQNPVSDTKEEKRWRWMAIKYLKHLQLEECIGWVQTRENAFFLILFLTVVKGPTSFKSLRFSSMHWTNYIQGSLYCPWTTGARQRAPNDTSSSISQSPSTVFEEPFCRPYGPRPANKSQRALEWVWIFSVWSLYSPECAKRPSKNYCSYKTLKNMLF